MSMGSIVADDFANLFLGVDPKDDTAFLCWELDASGSTVAEFTRSLPDTLRFIRCNINGRNSIKVLCCLKPVPKLVLHADMADEIGHIHLASSFNWKG